MIGVKHKIIIINTININIINLKANIYYFINDTMFDTSGLFHKPSDMFNEASFI